VTRLSHKLLGGSDELYGKKNLSEKKKKKKKEWLKVERGGGELGVTKERKGIYGIDVTNEGYFRRQGNVREFPNWDCRGGKGKRPGGNKSGTRAL